jgi:hypothetical protein
VLAVTTDPFSGSRTRSCEITEPLFSRLYF